MDANSRCVGVSHVLQSDPIKISQYAMGGFWATDVIRISNANESEGYSS